MTSLPSTSLLPCWVICTVMLKVLPSTLHKVLVSRSQLLLEPLLVNYSSVGWLMLSVVKGCVCILPCLGILLLISLTDGVELMIIIVATFAQALSGTADSVSIIGVLVVWRFIVSRHPFLPTCLTPSSDGRWCWRWLPFKCRHFLWIRFHKNSWSHDDCCLCCAGLG